MADIKAMEKDLEEKAAKWAKNKGFLNIQFTLVENDKKQAMFVRFDNIPRKYARSARTLVNSVVATAVEYLAKRFTLYVSGPDIKAEGAKTKEYLKANKHRLLNILLIDGFDAFMRIVNRDAIMMQMQYDAKTMKLTEKGWVRWDGTILDDKSLQEVSFISTKNTGDSFSKKECC